MRVKKRGYGIFYALLLAFVVQCLAGTGLCLRASADDFSASISGATGWGTTSLTVYQEDMSAIGTIEAKEPFRILGRYNENLLQIEYNGMTGYVDTGNVLINLPDVEPDIIYNLTNATGSVFTATTESGTTNLKLSIFGDQLYYNGDVLDFYDKTSAADKAGKVWNEKLGKYEFIVPILFTAAERISAARSMAAADGYNFKIYDAYRTNTATHLMSSSFNSLYEQSRGALVLGGYDTSFYVASALSAHNIGCAIDVTMVRGGEEADMPTKMHVLSGDAVLLNYSSGGRMAADLYGKPYSYYENNFAGTMTEEAKRLCAYMIEAGLTGLGSEWWHFQDQAGYNRNSGYFTNLATWYPCRLYAPAGDPDAPDIVTTRADAVYQLWAAAGFPKSEGEIMFTDVSEYDYYYNAVRWAVSKGIISGSSAMTFSPDDAITKAGFLNMLYQAFGNPEEAASDTAAFDDVSTNAWYYIAVQWAAARGIVTQTSGEFRPAAVLTQRQMHEFLTLAEQTGISLGTNYL